MIIIDILIDMILGVVYFFSTRAKHMDGFELFLAAQAILLLVAEIMLLSVCWDVSKIQVRNLQDYHTECEFTQR